MKTTWQKVYSFFGFWTYTEWVEIPHIEGAYCPSYDKKKTIYWCLFPWFKFYKKIDLFSWSIK